jgi:hypothetical protein
MPPELDGICGRMTKDFPLAVILALHVLDQRVHVVRLIYFASSLLLKMGLKYKLIVLLRLNVFDAKPNLTRRDDCQLHIAFLRCTYLISEFASFA